MKKNQGRALPTGSVGTRCAASVGLQGDVRGDVGTGVGSLNGPLSRQPDRPLFG